MRSLLTVFAVPAVLLSSFVARADDANLLRSSPVQSLAPPKERPLPRLKLSLVRFQAGHPAGGTIALDSLHLDMYALSWRYFRAGVDVEGGMGHTTLMDAGTALRYGLLGANAGVQLPGRITPFVEARLAAGVMGGTIEDSLKIPGTTVSASGVSAATWMWATGVDAGAEFYVFGRTYISAAIGWIRSTWRGADYDATGSGLSFKDVKNDSLMFKLGFGI